MAGLTRFYTSLFGREFFQPRLVTCMCREFVTSKGDGPKPPKRPLNSFMLFFNQNMGQIRARNPGLTHPQIAKEAGKMYQSLSEHEKMRLKEAGQKNQAVYQQEYKSFMDSLSNEEKQQLEQESLDLRIKKRKQKLKNAVQKESRELNKPKASLTAFMLFANESRADGLSTGKVTEQAKENGERWKNLTSFEKQYYIDKATDARKVYEEDLKKWESKMMQENRYYLVRKSQWPLEVKKIYAKTSQKKKKKRVVAKKSGVEKSRSETTGGKAVPSKTSADKKSKSEE